MANQNKSEKQIQNEIRLTLSAVAVVHRINVGVFKTTDGRVVSTGVPTGFTDLFGHRRSDGRAFYLEVKKPGQNPRANQTKFMDAMRNAGAIAGVATSADEAMRIVMEAKHE